MTVVSEILTIFRDMGGQANFIEGDPDVEVFAVPLYIIEETLHEYADLINGGAA